VLLGICLYDSCLAGWFSIWWIKVFAEMLSSDTLSTAQVVRSGLGIVALMWVIKNHEIPSWRIVFSMLIVSYLGLFALLVSPEFFWIISTMFSVLCSAFGSAFNSAIKVQNVEHKTRNRFDNKENLMMGIGGMLGGGLAYFFQATGIPYWLVWMFTYFMFDLDMFLKGILIKCGFFNYDMAYNKL